MKITKKEYRAIIDSRGWLTLKNGEKIKFCISHNDKMFGLWSLSTAPTLNKKCIARAKNPRLICSRCYSMTMNKRFKELRKTLENNYNILTSRLLTDEEIPQIPVIYFRFEAFGDLANATQCANYIKIAAANPRTKFALWTKNPMILLQALQMLGYNHEKPQNLKTILSSPIINQKMDNNFWFIDKVFSVYDKQYIKENNININCGARSCFSCGKCYEKNSVKDIAEELK